MKNNITSLLNKILVSTGLLGQRMKRVEERLDWIDANLSEHMHRTDLLEKSQESLNERVAKVELPIQELKGIRKFLAFLFALLGALYYLTAILK